PWAAKAQRMASSGRCAPAPFDAPADMSPDGAPGRHLQGAPPGRRSGRPSLATQGARGVVSVSCGTLSVRAPRLENHMRRASLHLLGGSALSCLLFVSSAWCEEPAAPVPVQDCDRLVQPLDMEPRYSAMSGLEAGKIDGKAAQEAGERARREFPG